MRDPIRYMHGTRRRKHQNGTRKQQPSDIFHGFAPEHFAKLGARPAWPRDEIELCEKHLKRPRLSNPANTFGAIRAIDHTSFTKCWASGVARYLKLQYRLVHDHRLSSHTHGFWRPVLNVDGDFDGARSPHRFTLPRTKHQRAASRRCQAMAHEISPQRTVGISGHRVFGYTYGRREHSTMYKVFISCQYEHVIAVATDATADFRQFRQVRLQRVQFVQSSNAYHDLRMAGGDNLNGTVAANVLNVESERPHNPITLPSRQGLLELRLRLRHYEVVIRVVPHDLYRQDARPNLLNDRARRQCMLDGPHVVRCNRRVTARWDFRLGGEEADPDIMACMLRHADERRLRVVQFPRDRLHLVITQPIGIRDDPCGVAGEPLGREGVHLIQSVLRHDPLLRPCNYPRLNGTAR